AWVVTERRAGVDVRRVVLVLATVAELVDVRRLFRFVADRAGGVGRGGGAGEEQAGEEGTDQAGGHPCLTFPGGGANSPRRSERSAYGWETHPARHRRKASGGGAASANAVRGAGSTGGRRAAGRAEPRAGRLG